MEMFTTIRRNVYFIVVAITVVGIFYGFGYVRKINSEIKQTFDGQRWSLPAVVYARPLELYPGLQISAKMVGKELQLAGYRLENPIMSSGGYYLTGNMLQIISRDFSFPTGAEKSANITVSFDSDNIRQIVDTTSGNPVPSVRLDPARIGSFHPLVHEDRIVLSHSDIPLLLKQTLLAVEDEDFYSHHGIAPTSIARAFISNLKAGKAVQGGSTITQQLVKNLFLNRERTISRKIQEALMALLLEHHTTKDDILTAYINEVFLGQDGNRAIHGFGLASQFYFRRDLADLSSSQIATLVGMVKGPSYYDLRRFPERCLERRNLVLHLMLQKNIIGQEVFATATAQSIVDVTTQKSGFNRFPAFLDLVKRQLQTEYKEEDLNEDGLKILTTLDPQIQWEAERQFLDSLAQLESQKGVENLEGAVIITGRETGEIQAAIGSRGITKSGFNRALDARRPAGSLIKPSIYLAAIEKGYSLASPLLDANIQVKTSTMVWSPKNYDNKEHGRIALYQALANSYNLATVRLGMDLGLETVISALKRLGITQKINAYPSLLLGAVNMTPLQVAQMYQTIGSGGFHMPLRAISHVMSTENNLLLRYSLEVEQRFSPEHIFLLTYILKEVISEGTGKSFPFKNDRFYAGKTGTSDSYRDSWFAGFSTDRIAVVWIGRDDNKSTQLSGATGALPVWGNIMEPLTSTELEQTSLPSIHWMKIDSETLQPTSSFNSRAKRLPFISGKEPKDYEEWPEFDTKEIKKEADKIWDSLKSIFE